ncbi:MAG TPA: RdgB/HAM1 family non-canonical purine NTP pyrophosphatase [Xanthomonadales bacterium]|nr:RdgB/HAM1 family non-canonical purine NTP pyrophosphatase [Xanthomonadales bacterium]
MTQRPALVIASGNSGKLRELQALLQPSGWSVHTQSEWNIEEAEENGLSFIENALIKARHASRLCGLPALGDDSGLLVDALDGAPGIRSARYAGDNADDAANNRKLLAALQSVPAEKRGAHFYCAMVLVRHPLDPAPLITTASWEGHILTAPRGTGGFGYDPLFWLEQQQCSSAELAVAEKNLLSHRGQALAAMVKLLHHAFSN